jgi:signal peptidase II
VVGVALALVVLLALAKAESLLSHTGFGVIIGGAMANIVDRYPDGLVTDFIRVGTFPSFNAADSFITVGVLLLLLEGFLRTRPFS